MPQTTKQPWVGFTNTTRKVIKAYFISAQAVASPFLCPNHRGFSGINQRLELAATPPQAQREAVFAPRWTLKRLVVWIKESHGMDCCRETVRKALKSWDSQGKNGVSDSTKPTLSSGKPLLISSRAFCPQQRKAKSRLSIWMRRTSIWIELAVWDN
jgi:hypothetical protein